MLESHYPMTNKPQNENEGDSPVQDALDSFITLLKKLHSPNTSYSESSDYIEYEDVSDRFIDGEDVIRVELRHCTGTTPNKDYLIGFVPKGEFPQEGETFHLFYHNESGVEVLKHVHSYDPIHSVRQEGNRWFFSSGPVNWLLTVIDCGN